MKVLFSVRNYISNHRVLHSQYVKQLLLSMSEKEENLFNTFFLEEDESGAKKGPRRVKQVTKNDIGLTEAEKLELLRREEVAEQKRKEEEGKFAAVERERERCNNTWQKETNLK